VSGIGPKVASAILGTYSPEQIILSVVAGDAVALSKAPGVGKKTAERIILELRDKVNEAWTAAESSSLGMAAPNSMASPAKQDAMEALLALGYGRTEVMQAVLEMADDSMNAQALIKAALKKLGR
jgi:Holliday junction DNA helicase RuvA